MGSFGNIDDAKAFVDKELSGEELVPEGEGIDPNTDKAWICWYEICEIDENGEPTDNWICSKKFYKRW